MSYPSLSRHIVKYHRRSAPRSGFRAPSDATHPHQNPDVPRAQRSEPGAPSYPRIFRKLNTDVECRAQPINFATVVTDFTTCHNTWFHPEATRCFVPTGERRPARISGASHGLFAPYQSVTYRPTEFCKDLAKKNGLVDEQIIQHGECHFHDFT